MLPPKVSQDVLNLLTRAAKSRGGCAVLTLDSSTVYAIITDLEWERISHHETLMHLQECQDVITDLKEFADWEADEWDAVERLSKIRERLGIE